MRPTVPTLSLALDFRCWSRRWSGPACGRSRGGRSARRSSSRARVQSRNFYPHTPPSTTPSTSCATLSPPTRTARVALSRWPRGGAQSQQPQNSWDADTSRIVTTPPIASAVFNRPAAGAALRL